MPETARHRHAFEVYFRMGARRSIERLHEALRAEGDGHGHGHALRTLYGWSSKFGWQERIADLERQDAEAEHAVLAEEHKEMVKRQLQLSLLLQQKGAGWLSEIDSDRATAAAAIRAIEAGMRNERELRVTPIDPEAEIRKWAIEKDFDPDEVVRIAERIVRDQ